MMTGSLTPTMAGKLKSREERVAVGLHLDLTFGAPLGPMEKFAPSGRYPALKQVLSRALLGALPVDQIEIEIGRQLDKFEAYFGRTPDFVDGHEHVHVLPGIRRALLAVLGARTVPTGIMVRCPSDSLANMLRRAAAFKATVVCALARGFRHQIEQAGFTSNHSFAGFSTFDARIPFGREFEGFLRHKTYRHLIMCHPGLPSASDILHSDRRLEEYHYLMNEETLSERLWHPDRSRNESIPFAGN